MIVNAAWRTWVKEMALLFLLLPGFPLMLVACGRALSQFGYSHFAFGAALVLHARYYQLPAAIFGDSMYPAEEFGPFPTPAGYAIAALFYAALAFVISFPINWFIRRRMIHSDESMQSPDHRT
jgi:hypothetical protein